MSISLVVLAALAVLAMGLVALLTLLDAYRVRRRAHREVVTWLRENAYVTISKRVASHFGVDL